MASSPPITVSRLDLARLEQLLEDPALAALPGAAALEHELERADVVEPASMPADVVTMNSRVRCVDEVGGDTHDLTLVYPRDADVDQHKVSVFAPVGAALLGLSVGQSIDWDAPGGRHLRLRVTGIEYQPEAAGDFAR